MKIISFIINSNTNYFYFPHPTHRIPTESPSLPYQTLYIPPPPLHIVTLGVKIMVNNK